MGVLNVTPDSFSDGGRYDDPAVAIAHGRRMVAEGADILDVGGESTRPGAAAVPLEEELARVLPVIRGLADLVPISIDTNKAAVAEAALNAGAEIVNDVSGGTFDPSIRAVVARHGAGYVIMHTRARPDVMQAGSWVYEGGVVAAVVRWLADAVAAAVAAGVSRDVLAVDPGIGFGKTVEENCALIDGLGALRALGVPILVGTSRKSFLGALTGRAVDERGPASIASVAIAVARGADILRVHDVAATLDAVKVADACTASRRCASTAAT